MTMNVMVEIEAEEMDEGLSLMEDLKSGGLNISSHTEMPGRVKIIGFIKKRWIVDSTTGRRVKLVCVNWPSHTQSMLIEGLNHRPLKELADEAIKLRFNCVRLTYATQMFTRYANRTVEENFDLLDLEQAKAGLAQYNPFVLNKTIAEAYEAVVDVLGESGLMVIADNHMSQPRWCCSLDDGNGFFGDRYFDPQEWLQGLSFSCSTLFQEINGTYKLRKILTLLKLNSNV
ncbi:uncharacterized protein LOC111797470 [Cucurbita pepo subsp. pepo]|uniref:uncharacterized protein LOC111797470 n=1 Tax=Cucurbita pepo subsp. pepo TaxID=3664 RepID=UPI000C9D6635|nr:uncharacterized protein LOC111797470 [Cucurbita pepo subsp. pepo]